MNIPKELVQEAMRLSDAASQTQAVIMGLEELIRKKKLAQLAALGGSGVLTLTRKSHRQQRKR